MKQAYITALTDSLLATENVDEVLVRTKELLAQKGHGRLWPAVLRGVVVELEKRASYRCQRGGIRQSQTS